MPIVKTEFVLESIQSALGQTYRNFEVVILNNAKTASKRDEIRQIVSDFSDDRITYYENEKQLPIVENWNKVLSYANGEYFVLLGDDDVMEPNYLEAFSVLIGKYPDLDVYHCRSYIINEKSEKIDLTPSWPEYETVYDNMLHRIRGRRLQYISDFVYRTRALSQAGGFYNLPQAWGSDDITSYIACGDKGIAHTNIPVFNCRTSPLSLSSSGNIKLKMEAILQQGRWLEDFLKKQPQKHDDLILWINLKAVLKKYIQKKKTTTISRSLNQKFLHHLFFWIARKKYYKLKIIEILYSIIEYFKSRITKREYQ
ncbi:MAG: glycosyltransferase family 2 protein [Desulfobacter postgatei]|uniref:glycosyltransferase family A protein n=1 Tax=Desulfobacter postgatei TaxID=2293 RepID=UPI0023EFEE52|nr:glycosyltransferase family 2 protein [Desulfobacter postgatei]MDD4274327.1 glycosyltransferase family 2 protein [Desulfobacter postgatei]